jgi:hypothetical protein
MAKDPDPEIKVVEGGTAGKPGGVALAVSGGGHRATILALGALMALVDRGVNRHILQLSSVSGGSILNGFILHRGLNFRHLDSDEFDDLAADLADRVIHRGVLTKWAFGFVVLVVISCAALVGFAGAALGLPAGAAILFAVLAGTAPLLGFGHFVQWRLRRVYFSSKPRELRDLVRLDIEHVFCATDLISGLPVYVTSWDGGRLWRRTRDAATAWESMGQMWDAEGLRIDEVVRASAGFPGIPPRRLRVGSSRQGRCSRRLDSPSSERDDRHPLALGDWAEASANPDAMFVYGSPGPNIPRSAFLQWVMAVDKWETNGRSGEPPAWRAESPLPWNEDRPLRRLAWPKNFRTMFLADGGISNNLGMQALREDGLFRGGVEGTWHPRLTIAMNASAPMKVRATWPFYLPGAALVAQLMRCMQVLTTNTVVPRVMASIDSARSRAISGSLLSSTDITVDLSVDPHSFAKVLRYKLTVAKRVLAFYIEEQNAHAARVEAEGIQGLERWDETMMTGLIERERLDEFLRSEWWLSLRDAMDSSPVPPNVTVPTTLGRFPPHLVRWMLLRGYMGGYVASLAAVPWRQSEPSREAIRDALDRIDRIAQVQLG